MNSMGDGIPLSGNDVRALFQQKTTKALLIAILLTGGFFYVQTAGIASAIFGAKGRTPNSILASLHRKAICQAVAGMKNDQDLLLLSTVKESDLCGIASSVSPEQKALERELYALVNNFPIRDMVPHIAKYDREVAAYVVGIAKKESAWGKRVPTKSGSHCYNYWGYRGAGSLGFAMGYGCFATPEEGVNVIASRIQKLMNQNIETPSQMVVWKCGRSCAGHDPAGVAKWISDVDVYYRKIAYQS